VIDQNREGYVRSVERLASSTWNIAEISACLVANAVAGLARQIGGRPNDSDAQIVPCQVNNRRSQTDVRASDRLRVSRWARGLSLRVTARGSLEVIGPRLRAFWKLARDERDLAVLETVVEEATRYLPMEGRKETVRFEAEGAPR